MTILVDTSVWSVALRRDHDVNEPEVEALKDALPGDELVVTTGVLYRSGQPELRVTKRDTAARQAASSAITAVAVFEIGIW
ncbi:MAG TPA: hypothetical protein PK177_06505 [Burkholderiaceae bacterium]|nr:hypothetical protein [Burkholderiaceae bacterium]